MKIQGTICSLGGSASSLIMSFIIVNVIVIIIGVIIVVHIMGSKVFDLLKPPVVALAGLVKQASITDSNLTSECEEMVDDSVESSGLKSWPPQAPSSRAQSGFCCYIVQFLLSHKLLQAYSCA